MASQLPESAKIGFANFQTTILIFGGIVVGSTFLSYLLIDLLDIKSLAIRKLIFGTLLVSGLLIASKVSLLRL